MVLATETILLITHFIIVFVGYSNVFIDFIGNLVNILGFTQLRLFQRNPSALYLTVASIVDFSQLVFPISADITVTAFDFDPTRTSIVWCKLHAYLAKVTRIISTITIFFAAIDQYLSTSYNPNLRRLSTFNSVQYLTTIIIIFSLLYSILLMIFSEIHPNFDCATFNPVFNYFDSLFHYCVLVGWYDTDCYFGII
ncbi:unnamed protein product [Rotaria socialis]